MLPSPDQNLKIGSVGRDFFFFLRTVRELSFPIFFLKFLNGENLGGMQSKRIYKSCKCFFKPLNTNFSKFFAQIWHKKNQNKKQNKKPRPCFFAFYGRSGESNITKKICWPYGKTIQFEPCFEQAVNTGILFSLWSSVGDFKDLYFLNNFTIFLKTKFWGLYHQWVDYLTLCTSRWICDLCRPRTPCCHSYQGSQWSWFCTCVLWRAPPVSPGLSRCVNPESGVRKWRI